MASQTDINFRLWLDDPQFPQLNDHQTQHALRFIAIIRGDDMPKPLYNHQREAILRVIFTGETMGNWQVLLDIVTGGGKTVIMAALAAYFWQVHGVQKFLLLTPNTTVRERVKDDFEVTNPGFAFGEFPLFFNSYSGAPKTMVTKVLRGQGDEAAIKDAHFIVANIHQLYEGKQSLEVLLDDAATPPFVVLNDEAHNSAALEYRRVLSLLTQKGKVHARIDLTATPYRLDKQDIDTYPPIYEYHVQQATRDNVVKHIIATKPDIESVKMQVEEWDDENNVVRTLEAEEVPWDQIEGELRKSGAVKFVVAKTARRQHLQIAESCLNYQRKCVPLDIHGNRQWEPIMLVVALSRRDAEEIYKTLQGDSFGYKSDEILLVHSKQEEYQNKLAFLMGRKSADGLSKDDEALWHQAKKIRIVVAISMLREGWDVRAISVICLFRKFSYQKKGDQIYTVYGPQIIGRGLRKIQHGRERDNLFVVDHPAFGHDWLWQLMGAQEYARPLNPHDDIDETQFETEDHQHDPSTDEPKVGETGEELDVDDIMKGLPDLPTANPIEDWQAYLLAFDFEQRMASAWQKITNIKHKEVIDSPNTAHELADDSLNAPDFDEVLLEHDTSKPLDQKVHEVLASLNELPKQALQNAFQQITGEELLKMQQAVDWLLQVRFEITDWHHLAQESEAKVNRIYFALPSVETELRKEELVLGIVGDQG